MKEVVIKPAGLWTAVNRYEAPPGAMTEATNVVFTKAGLLQTRSGIKTTPSDDVEGANFWTTGGTPVALFVRTLNGAARHYAATLNGKLYSRTAAGRIWSDNGSVSALLGQSSVKFAEAKRNLYVAGSAGVLREDSPLVLSGIPKPLSIALSSGGTTGGWLTSPGSVAYRAVLKYTDSSGNVLFSAPSGRAVFRNSGGTILAVTVAVSLPAGLSDEYWLQVYRSRQTSDASDEPSDEMGIVYERQLTSSEATNRSFSITNNDIVPDLMLGPTGYFCPSQEGILQANERPPLAHDIAWFKDSMFYANTAIKHRLWLRLISVGASHGLQNNDTVTIAGTTYTAKTTPGAAPEFGIVTSSSSPQVNIQATLANLVTAINTASANTAVYAYAMSGPDDPAGIFLVEERGLGGSAFAATSSRSTPWAPELASSGTAVGSDNEARKNRIYISKALQPEAVPLLSHLDVGSDADAILRIMPTRDSLFVFKATEGVWRIAGDGPASFRVLPVDMTVSLHAPDSLAATGNKLRFLASIGFYEASEAGVRLISAQINDSVESAMVSVGSLWNSFAIGHEADGLYVCWVPADTDESEERYASGAYVYSVAADTWTRWELPAYGAAYDKHNQGFAIGRQANTVSTEYNWWFGNDAHADDDEPIPVATTFTFKVAGSPATVKEWARCDVLLQGATATAMTAGFATDLDASRANVSLTMAAGQQIVASPVPQSKQLGSNLEVSLDCNQLNKKFALAGFVLTYTDTGEVATR